MAPKAKLALAPGLVSAADSGAVAAGLLAASGFGLAAFGGALALADLVRVD
jgi:hypothetical protein